MTVYFMVALVLPMSTAAAQVIT